MQNEEGLHRILHCPFLCSEPSSSHPSPWPSSSNRSPLRLLIKFQRRQKELATPAQSAERPGEDDNAGRAVPSPSPAPSTFWLLRADSPGSPQLPGACAKAGLFDLIPRVSWEPELTETLTGHAILGLDEKGLPRRGFRSSWGDGDCST